MPLNFPVILNTVYTTIHFWFPIIRSRSTDLLQPVFNIFVVFLPQFSCQSFWSLFNHSLSINNCLLRFYSNRFFKLCQGSHFLVLFEVFDRFSGSHFSTPLIFLFLFLSLLQEALRNIFSTLLSIFSPVFLCCNFSFKL